MARECVLRGTGRPVPRLALPRSGLAWHTHGRPFSSALAAGSFLLEFPSLHAGDLWMAGLVALTAREWLAYRWVKNHHAWPRAVD